MINIIYNEAGQDMVLRAEGHAEYAPKGQDIVCAAVSALMLSLACSVDGESAVQDGEGVLTVKAVQSCDNSAKFELVTDGLMLLAQQYPANVRYVNMHATGTDELDLQMFADGAAGGDGDAAGEGAAGSGAAVQEPALRPAQERMARRSRPGKVAKAAAVPSPAAAPAEEAAAEEEKPQSVQEAEGEGEQAEKKAADPAEKRRAFGKLMQGEYAEEFEEAMQRAAQMAVQSIRENPQLNELGKVLAEAYGIDMSDMDGLIDAVKNGRVKNDEYYETLAAQRGISVKTAREMDRMEGQLQRANAEKQQAEQLRLAAEHQQRAAAVRARWEAEAAKLKNSYPDFELDEVLNNPAVADMIRRGVGLEAAYRAAYFDRLMENQTARTAKQVEQGVETRIQQRSQRPAENGTHPGGAAEMKVDVAHMTRQQRKELARRAQRGERIVL